MRPWRGRNPRSTRWPPSAIVAQGDLKLPKCRPFVDERGGHTGPMDKSVVFLAAHRTLTQPLPRKGVRLLMIGPKGSVSMALAPQRRMERARRKVHTKL